MVTSTLDIPNPHRLLHRVQSVACHFLRFKFQIHFLFALICYYFSYSFASPFHYTVIWVARVCIYVVLVVLYLRYTSAMTGHWFHVKNTRTQTHTHIEYFLIVYINDVRRHVKQGKTCDVKGCRAECSVLKPGRMVSARQINSNLLSVKGSKCCLLTYLYIFGVYVTGLCTKSLCLSITVIQWKKVKKKMKHRHVH